MNQASLVRALYHPQRFGKGLYELSNQGGMLLKKKANIAQLKEYVKRAQLRCLTREIPPSL